MNGVRLERIGEETLRLHPLNAAVTACLLEVPNILSQSKSGPAHDRLYPMPTENDVDANEDWRQLIVPELERLFAEAGKILANDIEPLAENAKEITFPAAHCDAWISAINQARLILGAQHAITEQDMEELRLVLLPGARQQAVLRIHILGFLVQLLVEHLAGE